MAKKKKKKAKFRAARPTSSANLAVGVAWYDRDQWTRLRQVCADADGMEDTYDAWLAGAEELLRHVAAAGQTATRVRVDVDELVEWCRQQGVAVDAKGRSEFAAELLRRQHEGSPKQEGQGVRRGPDLWWRGEGDAGDRPAPGAGGVDPDPDGALGRRMRLRDDAPRRVPHRDQWQRLYGLAEQVKALAPWEWMEETEVFGVRVPQTGDLVFVSVMGQLGEHLAVAVYPGTRALSDYWKLATGDTEAGARILEIPQLHLSFEDRDLVEGEDRAVMKQLALSGRYRGRQAYPLFRTYRPGYAPWFIDADEAEALACCLEQLLDVAPRHRDGAVSLGFLDDERMLIREPAVAAGGPPTWHDQYRLPQRPEPLAVPNRVGTELVSQLRSLPGKPGGLALGLFRSGAIVQKTRADRPEMPYVLVVADPDSGILLGMEMLTIDPDLPGLLAQVPGKVLEVTARAGSRPAAYQVEEVRLAQLLEPACAELGIEILVGKQPFIEHLRRDLGAFLAR